MIGQVTAVISSICRVAWAAAPSTDHANGAWPCSSSHGKKWSEIAAKANPACSARIVLQTRAVRPVLLCHQLVAELVHLAIPLL
jgi:hypothetical protein